MYSLQTHNRKTVTASSAMTLLDPVGAITKSSGTMAAANSLRFSTKQFEPEVGIGCWGYRWYAPNQQRWLSRDPIGEDGGVNLHAFAANAPDGDVDALGLAATVLHESQGHLGDEVYHAIGGKGGKMTYTVSYARPTCSSTKTECCYCGEDGGAKFTSWFYGVKEGVFQQRIGLPEERGPGKGYYETHEFLAPTTQRSIEHEQRHVRFLQEAFDKFKNELATALEKHRAKPLGAGGFDQCCEGLWAEVKVELDAVYEKIQADRKPKDDALDSRERMTFRDEGAAKYTWWPKF